MSRIALPNNGAAPFGDMSELDAADIDIIGNGVMGNGVLSGCVVTAQGTPDATTAVASGFVVIDGSYYNFAGGNSSAITADGTNPRVAVIALQPLIVGVSLQIVVLLGTPAPDPPLPTIPASTVALKYVRVPAGSAIAQTANMIDKTMLLPTAIVTQSLAINRTAPPGAAIAVNLNHIETAGANRTGLIFTVSETYSTTAAGNTYRGMQLTASAQAQVALTSLRGIDLTLTPSGNSNIAQVIGVNVFVSHQGVSPQTISNSYGVLATVSAGSGTEAITKVSLLAATAVGASTTVTTLVGLDLSDLGTLAATNKWGIQVGDYQSYHLGRLMIGQAAAPDANSDLTVARSKTVASPTTDRGVFVSATIVLNAAATRIGLHVSDSTSSTTSKPSIIVGVQADSVHAAGAAGVTEVLGVWGRSAVSSGLADTLVGVAARPTVQGTGSATFAYGVYIDSSLSGSGSIGTTVGLFITNIAGTDTWGIKVANFKSYHWGPLTIGSPAAPATSAVLDLVSTTGAFVLPRMTTTQRNALTAIAGMKIFNSTTVQAEFYDGTSWLGEQDGFVGVSAAKATSRGTALTSGVDAGINFVNPQMRAVIDATNNKVDVFIPAKIPATPRSGQWCKSEGSGVSNSNPINATQDLILTPLWIPSSGAGVLTITELGVLIEVAFTALTLSYGLFSCDNGGFPVSLVASTGTVAGTTNGFKNVVVAVNYAADPLKYWIGALVTGTFTVGTGTIRTHAGMLTGVPQVSAPGVGVNDAVSGLRVTGQATMPASLSAATFATVGSAPVVYATVQ